MTTQLALYNEALTEYLGERMLSSLTENREPRRILDEIWNAGFIKHCLEEGQWVFARRSNMMTYNPSVAPTFGYRRAFTKPADFVRTSKLCSDEYMNIPLTRYVEESGFYFADIDIIYMAYISNDANYGGNMALWPESFVRFAACMLAIRACKRLTQSATSKEELLRILKSIKADAMSKNALEGPTQFMPQGNWTASRSQGPRRLDRGNRGQLIG